MSDTQYRAEVHAALIIRKPGCYTRDLLSEHFKISLGTQQWYEKDTGIRVTAQ